MGYFNKLSFTSDQFWDADSSHTMSQDGELKLQLLYPYDSSRFDTFIFQQESDFQMYYSNVKDIKNQRSCVENSPLNFTNNQIMLRKNNITFNISDLDKQIVVIDNTKYPCNNGSYYPLIQLYYEYTVTFNFEYSYYYACKSVILIGVLVILIIISGIIICYFRQRKLRKKLLKKQLEENQMLEQKDLINDINNSNNENITSEFQSDKSVVNSLASFSAGFQKSYHQKSFFQNSLQQSQNLNSRAANTQSGKSLGQQSQYGSLDDNSIANKLSRNVDSRRDTGNNRSIYDDKKSSDNSFNVYNETSFNSDQQFSFVDKFQPKQFTSNNSLPKTNNSFIKNNNTINYYQNEELHKIQEEDAIPGSPQLRFKKNEFDLIINLISIQRKKRNLSTVSLFQSLYMSSNINRPKSLAGNKFKPPTPLIQNKNVKKRDSFRVQQENNYDNDINDNNQRNSIRLKSHKGNIAQNNNGQLTGYYNGQIQTNNDGLLYFGGNIGGQNSSKSNKRFFTSNVLNSQNSKEYNDQITDEFNDNNIVQKNLQLQLDEINNEACNNVPKLIKQNLNSKNNSAQSTSQSSSTTPISTNGFQQSDNKKSKLNGAQQAGQSKSSKKGEKYISIKDTIAAYKEVEQKLIMKSNDINGRPPLLISTNNQIGISSITPQSITSNQAQNQQLQQNLINSIKQVYSEERLNIIGSSCQQQNIDKKGIPFGVNLNQRPGLNSAANSSSSTTHKNNNPLLNKENSTTGSSFQNSNQATNTIYNYLVNPSAALPPSKINSINVFRIKKQQSSTRSSYNQQTPQQNNYYQLDGNNNFYIQQIFNSQKSKQQNFLNQESDEEQSNEKNNTSFNCYDSNNPKSTTQNQNQLKQKYQLAPQSQITADEFNYQDSSQLDKNSSKLIGSNRYIQNNRQILSAQRPPKGQNKSAAATNQNSTNNTSSMQLNENKKIRFSHAKRNSEKFTGNTINTQSNWSPEASICQQDDASSDEIQLSSKSNRSQSSQSKPNNFSSVDKNEKGNLQSENSQSNSYSKNTDTNQSLQKSSLLLKIQKQNEHCSQILSTINTAEIKPLYWKSQVIDDIANTDYERNILILKAENLLFGGFTSESYWEKKDNQGQINGNGIFGGMINFNGNSSNNIRSTYLNNGNSGYQGDIYSNKLNEIKRILRTLSKHYLIFLLFNSCSKKVRDLVSFMIKQSFSFDGAYYTYNPQSYSIYSNKCVNLQQIIIDYKLQSKVNKIIIFDAVPSNFQANLNQSQFQRNNFRTPAYSTHKKRNLSYQPMRSKSGVINTESEPYLAKDQFQIEQSIEKDDIIKSAQNQNCFKLKKELHFQLLQEFIPKFEEKIIGKAKVVLFKQRINPNLLQANQKKVLEVALSFVDPRISSFSNNLYFLNLDVQDVTAQAYEEGLLNHRKRNFLKEINKVKQQNKNTKEVIELDSDKVAENFRNRLIEYMKSTNKQIHNLYYLVGDLVVRNRNIFQKYYTDPFHCKKKNVDNLLQLDMLRYKPFPKLSKQMYFRGKQAQDYQNLMKQLPQKNPYDILFFPEENINNPYQQKPLENSQIITSQKDQNIETISLDVKQSQNNQIKEINEINIKKKCTAISYNLPFSIYLCMEVQI